jgi:hypothetical protein
MTGCTIAAAEKMANAEMGCLQVLSFSATLLLHQQRPRPTQSCRYSLLLL